MINLRERILTELGVRPAIVPEAEIRRRVGFLKDYLRSTPARGYVLAVSGGQDSALAGRLCQLASQELRAGGQEATFVAVRLPYGVQADERDAQIALEFIQPDQVDHGERQAERRRGRRRDGPRPAAAAGR